MGVISELSDELLIKILSSLPTKDAVSTSILSKQWEFLWMWLPKLDYETTELNPKPSLRGFIEKNLPLHKAPVIETLALNFCADSFQPEDIKKWVGIAVSRSVREVSIRYGSCSVNRNIKLPNTLYTCKTLVALKLEGLEIFVDVTKTVSLPCLKTMQLHLVSYLNDASLRFLVSACPVLEDLVIERDEEDNLRAVVVIAPSLLRLTLQTDGLCSNHRYTIFTPCLKYFKVEDYRERFSYLIEHSSGLEEADITVLNDPGKLLESFTSVKRLSIHMVLSNRSLYGGIALDQLEVLKLRVEHDDWSELVARLLINSPKLQVLDLNVDRHSRFEHKRIIWNKSEPSVPECLLNSLETFEFEGYKGRQEERDFFSFFFKNARCLKSSSIQSSTMPDFDSD